MEEPESQQQQQAQSYGADRQRSPSTTTNSGKEELEVEPDLLLQASPFRRPSRKRRRDQNLPNTNDPNSFFYYDTLSRSSTATRITEPHSSIVYYPEHNVRQMKLSALIGYTRRGEYVVAPNVYATKGLLMGMHHFNTRNTSLIHNLDDLTRDCNLQLVMDLYDTERTASTGSRLLTQHVHSQNDTTAVIGAVRSAVSIPLAVLNAARSIPQISYVSTSSILDNRESGCAFWTPNAFLEPENGALYLWSA